MFTRFADASRDEFGSPLSNIEHDYQLAIVRLYRSVGVVDWTATQTIRNARAAGFQRIEAYFLPCRICDEPAEQVRQIFTLVGFDLFVLDQMIEALEYLKDENVLIDRLWIDVGGRWPNTTETNVVFLESLIQPIESYGVKFGISTTRHRWGKALNNTAKFSVNIPLWYSQPDDVKSFDDFQTFGGWIEPSMKQCRVDVKECGVVFDRNFV